MGVAVARCHRPSLVFLWAINSYVPRSATCPTYSAFSCLWSTQAGAVTLQMAHPAAVEASFWHPVASSSLIFRHCQKSNLFRQFRNLLPEFLYFTSFDNRCCLHLILLDRHQQPSMFNSFIKRLCIIRNPELLTDCKGKSRQKLVKQKLIACIDVNDRHGLNEESFQVIDKQRQRLSWL